MWLYEKRLQYPVSVKRKDLHMAKNIITQIGGPNGELGAFLRYINQRYTMPDNRGRALLTDIATEEMAHMEILSTIVYQLIKDASIEEIKDNGLDGYYSDFGKGIYPVNASGVPFSVTIFAVTGDPLADLSEDMAAEQKARAVYDNLMSLTNDPDILAPLSFLRQREVVHYVRFKELFDEYVEKGIK